jgi:hypothetical protein
MNSFRAAAVVGAGAVMACATPAMAEIPLGCQDANAVRAALAEEGQVVVVSAVRGRSDEQPRNIFTSNQSGTRGYNIEQGTGDARGQLCVSVTYTDVRLNPNRDLSTPSWALRADGSPHNEWLRTTGRDLDNRVLMGATVLREENGVEVRGGFMMVTRARGYEDVSGTGGSVTLTLSSGEIRPTLGIDTVQQVQPNYDAFVQRNELNR